MKQCFVLSFLLFLGFGVLHGQSEATTQAEKSFKEADARLNQAYQETLQTIVREKLPGHPEEDLRKSQRAWLKFRDAEASARALVEAEGGSIYSTYYCAFLAKLTEDRIKQLEECYLEKLSKKPS